MRPNACLRFILTIHAALMRLYPPGFRAGFGGEMQAVFSQTAHEATEQGVSALGKLFLRELRDLPAAALQERLLDWRSRVMEAEPVERLSRREMLAALAVFLIPAGFILLNSAPPELVRKVIPPAMLVLLLMGLVTGLIKRFPRWSLPYFGLVLAAIVFLFLFQWQAERLATFLASRFVAQPSNELGRLLLTIFWDGVVWLSLFVLASFVILILAIPSRLRPKVQRLQEDWTRLSYLLYSGSMIALVLAFDEYRFEEPFALTALLCLAAGAWGYLRSSHPIRGFLALLIGATLSMWVAATGKWLLVPYQDWTVWFRWHPSGSERWFEVQRVLIDWVWLVVVMALPALLRLMPRPRGRIPAR